MKLLTKTTLFYLGMTMVLFVAGGGIFHYFLKEIINESITERMFEMEEQVIEYAQANGTLPPQSPIGLYAITFEETEKPVAEQLTDTLLPDEDEEPKPSRILTFPVQAGGIYYSASITRQLMESDELIESIALSLGVLTAILLVVLFALNWMLSRTLWKPFYTTLGAIRDFDVASKKKIALNGSDTSEFKELNEAIEKMTVRIQNDYRSLKEFTENASHEIQTPLAIIRSKLELMIQSENIGQDQMKLVQDVYESANRLSKLNQSLLLLAKIENRQFHEITAVDMKQLAEKKLGLFEDMIAFKEINVERQLLPSTVPMNPLLADILLSNMISNAIRHNRSGGQMRVETNTCLLSVSNTGEPLSIPSEKLFERFQKGSTSSESVGLGLSIVKQICDTYHFKVSHSYSAGTHTISVRFQD